MKMKTRQYIALAIILIVNLAAVIYVGIQALRGSIDWPTAFLSGVMYVCAVAAIFNLLKDQKEYPESPVISVGYINIMILLIAIVMIQGYQEEMLPEFGVVVFLFMSTSAIYPALRHLEKRIDTLEKQLRRETQQ